MNLLLSAIPLPWKLLAAAALAAALVAFGFVQGCGHVQTQWDAATAAQTQRVAVVRAKQAEATVRIVTDYVDRVRVVRERAKTITKEVKIYVPQESDVACAINRGFVRLHDAAARGDVSGTPEAADASPAGIKLSGVASTLADNYARCRENAEQLTALQEWVKAQQAASADP
jgi:hypothetical protein